MIALLAGFLIFPAVFSYNLDPAAGPGLVFVTLPVIFSKMPFGIVFGSLFFLLLIIAALTSTISLLEVPVSFLIDEKKWSRKKSTILFTAIAFLFGIPSALSSSVPFFARLPLFKTDFISLWDKIWGNISLGLGALLLAVFVGWVWKARNAREEIFAGRSPVSAAWYYLIRYISPVIIAAIFVFSIIS
jgi:NSS family neurotransmitter:Na+ symporter